MKTLKLSILLAISLMMGYTYAATNNTESYDREEYPFGFNVLTVNESINISTKNKNTALDSDDREEYVFEMEISTVNTQVNHSTSTPDIWNGFLANNEFDFD
jgi:hypothetical protein